MSKAAATSSTPTTSSSEYGADSLRLYEMFMGPLEATKPWSMRGVEGVYRFLSRVWRLIIDDRAEDDEADRRGAGRRSRTRETLRKLHQTIQKVTEDLDGMRFNTAIAAMMEFTNHLTPAGRCGRGRCWRRSCCCWPRSPRTWPRSCGRRWATRTTLAYEPWPTYDPALLKADDDRGAGAGQRQAAGAR